MTKESELSLLKFPCDFEIKIIGKASSEFEAAALSIIHQHAPDLSDRAIELRPSKNGNYMAMTLTIRAQSKEQLDLIYQALSSSPHIIMAL